MVENSVTGAYYTPSFVDCKLGIVVFVKIFQYFSIHPFNASIKGFTERRNKKRGEFSFPSS